MFTFDDHVFFRCAEPLSRWAVALDQSLWWIVLCCAVLYSAVLFCAILCSAVLCGAELVCAILFRTVLCSTVNFIATRMKKKRSTKFKGHTLINPKNTPFQYISKRGQNLISMTQPTNKCNKTTLFFYLNKRYEWNVIEWNVSNEMSTNK